MSLVISSFDMTILPGAYRPLPSPETLARLSGYTVLRTDQHGWIELTTDGEQLWVAVEKK